MAVLCLTHHDRAADTAEAVAGAKELKPGQSVRVFQARLDAELHGWRLQGDVDFVRLERASDGTLHVLTGDTKSAAEAKVEHRFRVAFYTLMLGYIPVVGGIAHAPVRTGGRNKPWPTASRTSAASRRGSPHCHEHRRALCSVERRIEAVAHPGPRRRRGGAAHSRRPARRG